MLQFSICLIAKNEAQVLHRCIQSLENFRNRGGKVYLLDTGSTDNTVGVGKSLGIEVIEVGTKFIRTIDEITAQKINKRFIVNGEEKIVRGGDKLFDFASARNYIAEQASTNMIMCVDCDEVITKMDIDAIEALISEGYQQFEYNFIYAHDPYGNPAIEFVQSKFYDKRLVRWFGIVHEVLQGPSKIKFIDKNIYLLEHFQVGGKDHRSNYLVGLSLDCIQNLNKDRQSHYFARELMYTGRYRSAIKEFERHINMNGWRLEAAQSMIYIGDCYGKIAKPDKQAEWYHRSFHFDSTRNEALLKLALFYRHNNNKLAVLAYAKAALEIPLISYYANNMEYYTTLPHELLYWAYGWVGNIPAAQKHITKALHYQPDNPNYLRDTKYYFEYPDTGIDGFMMFEECQAIYNMGKKYMDICEVGSWKGRSTHAFLTGCKGTVTAVDTWEGSKDPQDWTHDLAKKSDIFEEFKKNVGHFKNLVIKKGKSTEIAATIPDGSYDIVFIDAGHTYEEVKEDIRAWKSKARIALCGHDYLPGTWMGVIQAINEELGKPDELYGSVWVKYLKNENPDKAEIQKFTDKIVNNENFSIVKMGDGEILCMNNIEGKNCDNHPYSEKLGNALIDSYKYFNNLSNSYISKWQDHMEYESPVPSKGNYTGDLLLHTRISEDKYNFFKTLKFSTRKKVFIGPLKLKPVLDFLNVDDYVFITEINAFEYVPQITPEDNAIYMFCGGMPAKVWIRRLLLQNVNITCIDFGSSFDPIFYGKTRTNQLPMETLKNHYKNLLYRQSIPKKIFTIWLSETLSLPELVEKCIQSQKIEGYEHRIITLDDCDDLIATGKHQYLKDCLDSTEHVKWVKAADYLRVYYLYEDGGIYLDADVEILDGKNFDNLLSNGMFVSQEDNGFIGTAVMGASKGYPFLEQWLDKIRKDFTGFDNKNFESSVELLTKGYWEFGWYKEGFALLTSDYFYPYNHQIEKTTITNNTITHHHFMKTWVIENLPFISIIIPTLGREDGLKKCLESIKCLNYPKNRIETIVIEDEPRLGVPLRVKEGYEQSKGDYIAYAANDMEFTPDSLITAVKDSITHNKRLVVFDAGVRNEFGYTCEHFLIKRSLVEELGEIFDTRFKHFCVDDLLWKKAEKMNDAMISDAFVIHTHYSRIGSGIEFDEINKLATESYEADTKLYKEELVKLVMEN